MHVTCRNIADFLETLAPSCTAEDWDNTGFLLGDLDKKVERVAVCLDVTSKVAQEACEKGIDMLISHHPLIFDGLKRIVSDNAKGRILQLLIRNNICVYAAHTNLDAADNGVNDCLANILGLRNIGRVNAVSVKYGDGGHKGSYCRIGRLEAPLSMNRFTAFVQSRLDVEEIRVIGGIDRPVERVAVTSGAFDGDFSCFSKEKADVLITGDVKYHDALDAAENGYFIVDAGHFATERVVLPHLAEKLQLNFEGLEMITVIHGANPFKSS